MKLSLQEVAHALKSFGDLDDCQDQWATGVQTDSRLVKRGDIFFCLRGSRMDGHNFVQEAASRQASAVVVHQPLPNPPKIPVLLVDDTTRALGRLGGYWRNKTRAVVIGVTGSAGKTTTKELLAGVLSAGYRVGKSYQNWNNQIGLPLSLLNFTGEEDFWILELGINNPHDMQELGAILRPDAALILNVGPCHLEGLKDVRGVAAAKAQILDYLQPDHKAFINLDYPELKQEATARSGLNTTWFSCRDEQAHYHLHASSAENCLLRTGEKEYRFSCFVPGSHLNENLAALWAVALEYGLSPEQVQSGLSQATLPGQRLSILSSAGWTVIDDTYNANPVSMQAALNTAQELSRGSDLFLVLGDMAELGQEEENAHKELGKKLSRMDFQALFYCGSNFEHVVAQLESSLGEKAYQVQDPSSFVSHWKRMNFSRGVILFKGSRKAGVESFLQAFQNLMEQQTTG